MNPTRFVPPVGKAAASGEAASTTPATKPIRSARYSLLAVVVSSQSLFVVMVIVDHLSIFQQCRFSHWIPLVDGPFRGPASWFEVLPTDKDPHRGEYHADSCVPLPSVSGPLKLKPKSDTCVTFR